MLSRFHLILERYGRTDGWTDGRTDGRTDRQTDRFAVSISRVSMLTREKNHPILIKFGTLQQIFLKLNMAAAAILKIAFLAIIHRPIIRFQRNFV